MAKGEWVKRMESALLCLLRAPMRRPIGRRIGFVCSLLSLFRIAQISCCRNSRNSG
jgi:hypothetical protein